MTDDDGGGREPSADEHTDSHRALADAIRALVPQAVLTTVDDEAIARASALVAQAGSILAGRARSSRYEGTRGLAPASADNAAIWETHAVFGRSHPFAPPLVVSEHGSRLDATVTFGPAYEGGPGAVYGGFVAAAFDGALGRVVLAAGHLAVTSSLRVRYLRRTPLSVPLQLVAVMERVSGRQVEASARLSADDVTLCEADAVFTKVGVGRFQL